MTFEDALEAVVTFEEARHEIEDQHGHSMADFTEEFGVCDEYDGADVLGWLGY